MKGKTIYSDMKRLMPIMVILLFAVIVISPVSAMTVMPSNRNVNLLVSNDAGAFFDDNGDDTYNFFNLGQSATMGQNALHITTDPNAPYGQVTTSTTQSGTFYMTDTGGRAYDDDGILMLAVKNPVPDDLRVHIKSSGYQWASHSTTPAFADLIYVDGAVNEDFTTDDFKYGPQTWRPAPGLNNYNPIYYGQNMADTSNTFSIMFIDTNAGILGAYSLPVKVEYSFENLGTFAAFSDYAYTVNSNQGQGIRWLNRLVGSGSSGYSVTGIPAAAFTADVTKGPVPLTVQFTDASIGAGITDWAWDFGDGETSTLRSPVHPYNSVGTYTVKLTVTSPLGSDDKVKTDFITVQTTTEATQDLIAHVKSLGLKPSVETGLTDKLNYLLTVLDGGKDKEAINTVNAFIKQVNAQKNKAITPTDTASLIAEAQAIINSINFV